MHIINFGSTNIDIVFTVDHIVEPGETISSTSMTRSPGGKGANQSVAVARSGGHEVFHVGKIGEDGRWILEKLAQYQVRTDFTQITDIPTGQAIIQVAENGENSIVLYAGSNKTFTEHEIDEVLDQFSADTLVMLQNEINQLDHIIRSAHARGMHICLNPAPFEHTMLNLPLQLVSTFVLNEVEALGLSGTPDPLQAMEILTEKFPDAEIIITLGPDGVRYGKGNAIRHVFGTWDVPVVDTTAAGDTFIGCFIAQRAKGLSVPQSLKLASAASSITVMRLGAMDTIPTADQFSLLDGYELIR